MPQGEPPHPVVKHNNPIESSKSAIKNHYSHLITPPYCRDSASGTDQASRCAKGNTAKPTHSLSTTQHV